MRMVHAYMMSRIYMLISHHFDDGYVVVRAQLVKNDSCMCRYFFFLPYLLSYIAQLKWSHIRTLVTFTRLFVNVGGRNGILLRRR